MDKQPEISVIVPVYNIETYIKKCLDSILAQTFTDFEVIVVNDGSIDQSGIICDEFAKYDQRLKVIHQSNGGLSAARNKGISESRGNYLAFVDGDDWIEKHMFEKLFHLYSSTECEIAICGVGREVNGIKKYHLPEKETVIELSNIEGLRELFKGKLYRFAACNKLYKRRCFEGITFPVNKIHEDLATTYKVMARAKKVTFINYIGYVYVNREGSILNKIYNKKRLDSFHSWEEIIIFMDIYYPELSNEYLACFTYWTIDHMYYIYNQVDDEQKRYDYMLYIQKYIQKYYMRLIKSKTLNAKYKYLITLIMLNIKLFMLNYELNKRIK